MKGQFITVCCGRQNILPQCFAGPVDCLNEEWERISNRAASAQPRLAQNHRGPQYRPGSEVKSGAEAEPGSPPYGATSLAVADWCIIISVCSSTTRTGTRAVLKKLWVHLQSASDKACDRDSSKYWKHLSWEPPVTLQQKFFGMWKFHRLSVIMSVKCLCSDLHQQYSIDELKTLPV